MKLNREQILKRQHEFPQIIIDLSHNNVSVHRMIQAYVHGSLMTKEEAYCQMIVELAKSRDEIMDNMINEAHSKTMMLFQP